MDYLSTIAQFSNGGLQVLLIAGIIFQYLNDKKQQSIFREELAKRDAEIARLTDKVVGVAENSATAMTKLVVAVDNNSKSADRLIPMLDIILRGQKL